MKASVVLFATSLTGLAAAHGIVTEMTISGKSYVAYQPDTDPYQNPHPPRISWSLPNNGPVFDVTSKSIVCNVNSQPGELVAPVTAGSDIEFFWTKWPDSHLGPTMTYLASCTSGDCRKEDPSTLDWFKINHAGLNPDGTWISQTIIKNNNTWTLTIPKELKPGPYLMRHELLALHASESLNGAQFYPMCVNLDITGTGTGVPDKTVKFPGAYKPDDKGILINIWWPKPTSYDIPGPPVATLISGNGAVPTTTPSAVQTVETPSATPTVYPVSESPTETPQTTDSPAPEAPTETPQTTDYPVPTETPQTTDSPAPEAPTETPQTTDSPVYESLTEAPQPTVTPTPTPPPPPPASTPTPYPTPTPTLAAVATTTPAPAHHCRRRKAKRAIREQLKKRNSV